MRDMKLIDISMNCYAHLIENRIYLYVDDAFSEILYVDNIENLENPMPFIMHEIELSSRASLYENMQFI